MSARVLPDHLQKIVEEELGEVPSRVGEDIRAIREWLEKQPHIIARTDDQTILLFLRGCKFRLQTVKEKMEEYYALRSLITDHCVDKDPMSEDMQKVLNSPGYFTALRVVIPCPVNEHGPQLFIVRTNKGDYGKLSVEEILKTGLTIFDIILRDVDHMVMGFHCIIDLEDFEYGYLTQLTPFVIKTLIRGLQNAYPIRLKGYIVLNAPSACVTLFETVKPLLFQKIRDRIFFCNKSDLSELYKIVRRDLLPKEYGGLSGTIESIRAEWKGKIESNRDWIIEDAKYGIDESKRVNGCTRRREDVDGSFRKLNLD
ncbi:hypothetical protein FQR65_LT00136 [Abscondita terminalis]|nr:hypothetical protein FQR65_LT00136 [Abscondita terminalis]